MSDKLTFQVNYFLYGEDINIYAIIELDQSVIDAVDDDWREHLYNLRTPEQIAAHICRNMVDNHLRLSQMDGWADMDDSMARMVEYPDYFLFDLKAVRLK